MGRKAGVTLEAVVDAAVDVADREGLDAATPSAVAARLGIRTPSLYHHVTGAEGLRRQVALRAARQLAEHLAATAPAEHGTRRLPALAAAYRSFATSHPGQHAALLPAPTMDDDPELTTALAASVAIVAAELPPDLTGDEAIHSIRALRSLLYGFIELENQQGFGIPVDIDASFTYAVDLLVRSMGSP